MTLNPSKRWILAGSAAALIAVMVAVGLYANRFQYDEEAHQNVVEAYIGHPVADWDAYRDVTFEACAFDEDTFELFVLMEQDLPRLQLDIQYACPNRMDEFTDITGLQPFN
jgi:hypothetical protein